MHCPGTDLDDIGFWIPSRYRGVLWSLWIMHIFIPVYCPDQHSPGIGQNYSVRTTGYKCRLRRANGEGKAGSINYWDDCRYIPQVRCIHRYIYISSWYYFVWCILMFSIIFYLHSDFISLQSSVLLQSTPYGDKSNTNTVTIHRPGQTPLVSARWRPTSDASGARYVWTIRGSALC